MSCDEQASPSSNTFLITRSTATDGYGVWAFDPTSSTLVSPVSISPAATFPRDNQLVAVGGYLLSCSPLQSLSGKPGFSYSLFRFDPSSTDPLSATPVQSGTWDQDKFWDYYVHYSDCPGDPDATAFQLIPATGYVLSFIPTSGRGTFSLWNFDANSKNPGTTDPLPGRMFDQDAFPLIRAGHQLLPIGNYVLDWVAETSTYTVYSFDPQKSNPLSLPAISTGQWTAIDSSHQLVVVGPYLLDWIPATGVYTLYSFDPSAMNPLTTVQQGTLPAGFDPGVVVSSVQTPVAIDPVVATIPGTMDFMRSQIKHVVYYMVESRSFDNILGWLYANGTEGVNWINAEAPFRGASLTNTNSCCGRVFNQYLYQGGGLSLDWDLNSPSIDPFHGTPDSIQQQWSGGYAAYHAGEPADMGGFVSNNGTLEVMATFSPQQLPILNGLGASFAVSDDWFSSVAGGTTTNRAYLTTGSGYDITVSYEGGTAYANFPDLPRRQSVWKVLCNNGITDWKIYYSVNWGHPPSPYTYHLFVSQQIPSVDAAQADYSQPIDAFYADAAAGTLPSFSFLEPVWYDPSGVFSSYHPTGDVIPGEEQLNKIYNAIKNGPGWDKTALVITFSKGGGIYDHVPSPRAIKAWPHDENDGFEFDAYGTRVPAIVVSPWVPANTVFRSPTEIPFDATSMLSTLLKWYGVPEARWGLGDRVPQAPSFETVFQQASVRTDAPTLTRSWDKTYPPVSE